jgi:ubiquinone/menaquinone biosynthesis C-methylase UbiE
MTLSHGGVIMGTVKSERLFLPAAGRDIFLPLYDPITRLLGVDTAREALLAQAELQPHQRVLDIGCGTGTLAVLIKRRHPTVEVIGLDPDPKALARARRKAERAGVAVRFNRGFSDSLGHPDGTFDRVFSSMMFHHLPTEAKPTTLREIRRVVRVSGRLELLDFAGPQSSGHGRLTSLIHSHEQLKDNDEDRVLGLIRNAGFRDARVMRHWKTFFGRLAFYQAVV